MQSHRQQQRSGAAAATASSSSSPPPATAPTNNMPSLSSSADLDCPVCLEPIETSPQSPLLAKIIVPCSHIVCVTCLTGIERAASRCSPKNCPVCRQTFNMAIDVPHQMKPLVEFEASKTRNNVATLKGNSVAARKKHEEEEKVANQVREQCSETTKRIPRSRDHFISVEKTLDRSDECLANLRKSMQDQKRTVELLEHTIDSRVTELAKLEKLAAACRAAEQELRDELGHASARHQNLARASEDLNRSIATAESHFSKHGGKRKNNKQKQQQQSHTTTTTSNTSSGAAAAASSSSSPSDGHNAASAATTTTALGVQTGVIGRVVYHKRCGGVRLDSTGDEILFLQGEPELSRLRRGVHVQCHVEVSDRNGRLIARNVKSLEFGDDPEWDYENDDDDDDDDPFWDLHGTPGGYSRSQQSYSAEYMLQQLAMHHGDCQQQ